MAAFKQGLSCSVYIFCGNFERGNEKENQNNDDSELMYFGTLENMRRTCVFSTIVT